MEPALATVLEQDDLARPGPLATSPSAPSVYDVLAEHQRTEAWELREVLVELQRWAEIFSVEFKLQLPPIILCVESLRSSCLGRFRETHNGLGLRGEVAIARRHVGQGDFGDVLGTLLHELLHAWQWVNGKPGRRNHHNAEFRQKAQSYGLIVDARGLTEYEEDSPFTRLLKQHGVVVPKIPALMARPAGQSKLKRWSCGCTNVRVAVGNFRARCL